MDAQNAAESDHSKHAGTASQQRRGSDNDSKGKVDSMVKTLSPLQKAKTKSLNAGHAVTPSIAARAEDAAEDRDSDAETIVLPGKDGHSPSKARKVRQEDKSESDGDVVKAKTDASKSPKHSHDAHRVPVAASVKRPGEGIRKKRPSISAGSTAEKEHRHRKKDAVSSGLSSAPTSPPQRSQAQIPHPNKSRRSDAALSSPSSDSEHAHYKTSTKSSLRDKLKSGERLVSNQRKAHKAESDGEGDNRKARRQRTTSAGVDPGRHKTSREGQGYGKHESRHRSISPPSRQHRRSISSQLPLQSAPSNGLTHKKRRPPPPLLTTDYDSDDSSPGGSPHPRSITLRSLATPASADSNVSPAKMGPHKKHLDAHGQTLLARACARGEYEGAKQRLRERPEDLNVADYAGNTPLQIAAINGCEDIVKLLVEAGCNLDCVNYDKDTPLLDAVDNGHLGVIKILLDAGVNPRKANVNGEEPIDRVRDDTENAEEIRAALLDARKRAGDRRRTSEDQLSHTENVDPRDSNAPESPRHSPAATISGTSSRRGGTVRSTKTRNDLLYMPLDDKTLRLAAGRGDEDLVVRILNVNEGMDDPESMVAAARGGHDLVIELLLSLGGANADPGPVDSLPGEFATPILAAIGQENIKVIKILLEQHGFDPTRRFKGETYYEIAGRRQGTNWKEEEQLLKNAYDEYKRSHKDASKSKSTGVRRDRDKGVRREDGTEAKAARRHLSSPTRDVEMKKKPTKLESPREKRRANSLTNKFADDNQKRGPGRPRKELSATSDRESPPPLSSKPQKAKRADPDVAALSSEGEAAKPRRKLVSKGELRGERDKQKRLFSGKEPPSPHEGRGDESSEKPRPAERYHDRAKALKRDDLKDRPSGEVPSKRHRLSLTPDRPNEHIDKDSFEAPAKRRRLDSENQDNRIRKKQVSDDPRPRQPTSSEENLVKPAMAASFKDQDNGISKRNSDLRPSGHHVIGERSIKVKSEDVDTPMPDVEPVKVSESRDAGRSKIDDDVMKKREMEEMKRRKRREEDEEEEEVEQGKKAEEEIKRRQAEDERKRRLEEEEAKKRRELEERERREAAQREEEARRRLLEEERKRKQEEEERRRLEQEQRLRKEQAEREAAEEARRQREEEERKERERRERAHREEMERKRAAREAELKRAREEQERARLEKLPPLLRWLDTCPDPKSVLVADKFKYMPGMRYDTIQPSATGSPEGREQWLLNTHVALLLGEKDLRLSRYTAWERQPVTLLAKKSIWRTEGRRYTLLTQPLWDFGRHLPGYFGDVEFGQLDYAIRLRLLDESWEKFVALDMFFVKLSDFLYTVPNIPHLRNIRIGIEYRELPEREEQLIGWKSAQKWRIDPDIERYCGFAPRYRFYVNGAWAGEELPTTSETSRTPFPEQRVPRRGLLRVYPDDPEYERICAEQGIEPVVNGSQTPSLTSGLHSSPTTSTTTGFTHLTLNGTDKPSNRDQPNGT